ncbi:MAG: carboxypeptidase regulatory-like domain-containing protein [Chitinophagaceae bacterium]|nr:carboxypeptidase regulatory-like domain-containing protein [Chitinophagaceae bacterium]
MNAVQNSKFRMYHAVYNHLLANQATWEKNTGFSSIVNRFKTLFATIGLLVGEKARKLAGVTLSKQVQKQALVDMALMISGTLMAIASEAKNVSMVKKMKFSRTELEDISSEKLGPICMQILSVAVEYKEKLALFSISDVTLTAFENQIIGFDTTVSAPRNAISERRSIVGELVRLFREADDVLDNQLDRTISFFQADDKLFTTAYTYNRIIVDKGTRSTQIKGVVTDSVSGQPLKNVLVSVEGTLFLTNTKTDGSFSLKVPVTGQISVKFELGDFESVVKEEVDMKLGKTTDVSVAMVKTA